MAKTVNLTIFGSNLELLSLEVLSNKQRTNFVQKKTTLEMHLYFQDLQIRRVKPKFDN